MNPEQFYSLKTQSFTPLILISQEQWQREDEALSALERIYLQHQYFQANLGSIILLSDQQGQIIKAFLGTGNQQIAQALAIAALHLPENNYQSNQSLTVSEQMAWGLAQYKFIPYKKSTKASVKLLIEQASWDEILPLLKAIFLTRDLINQPSNVANPCYLAELIENLAIKHQASFKQWVGEALLNANFPAIYTVGKASSIEPRLVSLTWGNPNNPKVTLIGKGVCFDSGGLNIKVNQTMRLMKKDMGGAAHAISLAGWIMETQLNVHLQLFVPAVENVISGNAFRPGDIITMRNGLTVEIDNTDAEGRLILADAMAYADEFCPDLVIDFATLTGAARVAVGTEIAAYFSNNDSLAQELEEAAQTAEEPICRLPLYKGYLSMLESTIADLVNSSASAYAGAITAALFLNHFIPSTVPWIHFDIMAWNLTNKPGKPEGGEAMGLKTVIALLKQRYSSLTENQS